MENDKKVYFFRFGSRTPAPNGVALRPKKAAAATAVKMLKASLSGLHRVSIRII